MTDDLRSRLAARLTDEVLYRADSAYTHARGLVSECNDKRRQIILDALLPEIAQMEQQRADLIAWLEQQMDVACSDEDDVSSASAYRAVLDHLKGA